MTKLLKILHDLSPAPVSLITQIDCPQTVEILKAIETKYAFTPNTLLTGIVVLINWFNLEKDTEHQMIRPSEEKELFARLKNTSDTLLGLLSNAGTQVRDRLTEIIVQDIQLPHNEEKRRRPVTGKCALPCQLEDVLELFSCACEKAIIKTPKDKGGSRPDTSMPRKIIFKLIEIYEKGTGKKASCYNNEHRKPPLGGKFYHFLVALNPILASISDDMQLGTPITIGDYAKYCLHECSKINTPTESEIPDPA